MIEHNECLQTVFDIIKKYATEIEPIDQNRIIAIMRKDGSEGCERKTVSRYLGKLRDKYGLTKRTIAGRMMTSGFITVSLRGGAHLSMTGTGLRSSMMMLFRMRNCCS